MSRITELLDAVLHERAKKAHYEELADQAMDHFGLTMQERIAFLKSIHTERRTAIPVWQLGMCSYA